MAIPVVFLWLSIWGQTRGGLQNSLLTSLLHCTPILHGELYVVSAYADTLALEGQEKRKTRHAFDQCMPH